jgi:hypothetical protein
MADDRKPGGFGHLHSRIADWFGGSDWETAYRDHIAFIRDELQEGAGLDPSEVFRQMPRIAAPVFGLAVLESFFASEFEEEPRFLVDDFLSQEGASLGADEKEFLTQLRNSTISLFEVVAAEPEYVFRDQFRRGSQFSFGDAKAGPVLSVGQHVLARRLEIGGRSQFSAVLLKIKPETAEIFSSTFEGAKREALADLPPLLRKEPRTVRRILDRILSSMSTLAIIAWLGDIHAQVLAGLHTDLVNIEVAGATRLVFPMLIRVADATERLDSAADFLRLDDSDPTWGWRSPDSDEGDTVLVWIEDDQLIIEATPMANIDALRLTVEELFGEGVGIPEVFTAYEDADDDDEDEPDLRERLTEALDAHYTHALDSQIPMLGDVSPREAMLSEEGRAKVSEWLLRIESSYRELGAGAAVPTYDFDWLWTELGFALPEA